MNADDDVIKESIKGEIYNHSGKKEPNARKISEKAIEQGIITQVIDTFQNDDYASAIVRGVDVSGRVEEDGSLLHFSSVMQYKILNLYEKEKDAKSEWSKRQLKTSTKVYIPIWFKDIEAPFELQPDGHLIPNLTLDGQIKIMEDMLRFKTFAVRTAITQAKTRVRKQLLNQEWRDPEEIAMALEEGIHVGKQKLIEKNERNVKKLPRHPETFEEAKDLHIERMKKYSGIPDAQIEQTRKQLEKQSETPEKEEQEETNDKPKITGGITQDTAKSNKEKTTVEKAIEDKEKRDKEKEESEEGFKTADKVESPPEDAEVLSHIKAIVISLKEDDKEINEINIKLHLAERKKAKAITDEQCNEVLDKLAKMSIEELINLCLG